MVTLGRRFSMILGGTASMECVFQVELKISYHAPWNYYRLFFHFKRGGFSLIKKKNKEGGEKAT